MQLSYVRTYVHCLLVPCLSGAPAIQRPPANLEVYEFGLAFFDCFPSLDTVPHPTVQWSYNGAPLDVSNTTKYSVSPRTARLFISRVTQSDAGDYSCTLSNIERTVPSTGAGTLTVMATPGGVCVCVCVYSQEMHYGSVL